MTYFISYDITSPKRLRKAAKTLENYGLRVQYSFFECEMKDEIMDKLKKELLSVIDLTEDSLFVYPLCEDCLRKTTQMGSGKVFIPAGFQIL